MKLRLLLFSLLTWGLMNDSLATPPVEMLEKKEKISFSFLPEGIKYTLTLISDGKHDKAFTIKYLVVDKFSIIEVEVLRRGGFVAAAKSIL